MLKYSFILNFTTYSLQDKNVLYKNNYFTEYYLPSTEHVNFFPSKNVNNGVIDMKSTPDRQQVSKWK